MYSVPITDFFSIDEIFREKIEQRMDTVQISKARKLAKKWIFEHKNKPEAQR